MVFKSAIKPRTSPSRFSLTLSLHLSLSTAYCLLFSVSASAGDFDKNSAGTTTAQFLKVASGARCVALGEACAALTDDATAMDWNPAGLIKIKKHSVTLMHAPHLAGAYADFLSYAERAGEVGSWGASLKYMNYGAIKRTNSAGVETGNFTPYDLSLNVGFATYITGFKKEPEERFVLGAAGKIVRSQLLDSDNTVSADIGILFPYLFENRLQLALSAQNIMGTLRYDKFEDPLPLILRLGSALRVNTYFLLTGDIVAVRDNYPFLAAGGEFKAGLGKDTDLFLRSGLNTRAAADTGGLRNLTFGAGLRRGAYSIDYSFSPFGELGSVHRISAAMTF
jgi:hypothetical protein